MAKSKVDLQEVAKFLHAFEKDIVDGFSVQLSRASRIRFNRIKAKKFEELNPEIQNNYITLANGLLYYATPTNEAAKSNTKQTGE